jgi:hypothetical protein
MPKTLPPLLKKGTQKTQKKKKKNFNPLNMALGKAVI